MLLALIVSLIVIGVVVLLGVVGHLIDQRAEAEGQKGTEHRP